MFIHQRLKFSFMSSFQKFLLLGQFEAFFLVHLSPQITEHNMGSIVFLLSYRHQFRLVYSVDLPDVVSFTFNVNFKSFYFVLKFLVSGRHLGKHPIRVAVSAVVSTHCRRCRRRYCRRRCLCRRCCRSPHVIPCLLLLTLIVTRF